MQKSKEWEDWKWSSDTCFRQVEFSLSGKDFICLVKVKPDKKTWILVYKNPTNPRDWFIREENVSADLWYYGAPIDAESFTRLKTELMQKL